MKAISHLIMIAFIIINPLWPSDSIWLDNSVNIGCGNGMLPDGTKPLLEPMLTYYQWGQVTIIWG